jgi:hypothetical protein
MVTSKGGNSRPAAALIRATIPEKPARPPPILISRGPRALPRDFSSEEWIMAKLDLYKLHKSDYITPRKPFLVDIRPAKYLVISGRGEPGGAMFQARLGALYNVAFTIKMGKKFRGHDYAICKLEGLWWGNKSPSNFLEEPREAWNWKLLIRTPGFIQNRDVSDVARTLIDKGRSGDVSEVQLESLREGRCIQVLHVGPYDQETKTIDLMREFAAESGLAFHGLHHEIYLSDPRRVDAVRLKTILRHPVR